MSLIEEYENTPEYERIYNNSKVTYSLSSTQHAPEENNNPERYDGDLCMQVIELWPLKDANGNMGGAAMCISSIIRYLWRLERKGDPLAQLDKVQWYLDRLRSYYLK